MSNTCTALQAANYLVYLMSDSCDDLTNMKINKLLYYAQGQSLLRTGNPLFNDKIEAWQHGPLVYSVYQHYRHFSDTPITQVDNNDLSIVDEYSRCVLFDVAREYGKYTASTLRNMTHKPGSPWAVSYIDGNNHAEIPVDLIADYFRDHESLIKPFDISISENDFIGYRDEEGYLVLPQEWDDEAI